MMNIERYILLIEDNSDHAELAEFFISEYNNELRVNHLSDGFQALKYIDGIRIGDQPPPWLVLLDLKVPKYDGHEILSAIKSDDCLKGIPVVIFSTSNAIKDIEKALHHGANSYIIKPMEPDSYSDVFTKILAYWELNQHQHIQETKNRHE